MEGPQLFKKPTSYLSPKLEGRLCHDKGGHGVFTLQPIQPGELLVVWGGEVITWEQLIRLPHEKRRLVVQVEENLYLLSSKEGPGDWVNHSCNPNAGIRGQVVLVAMRDIFPDEEIYYDYAMSDGTPYDEFECNCGSQNCRRFVTGEDWATPELWERYNGHFSPYLQRRIDRLREKRGFYKDFSVIPTYEQGKVKTIIHSTK